MKSLFIYSKCLLLLTLSLTVKSDEQKKAKAWEHFVSDYSKQVRQKLKEKSIPGAALSITHVKYGDIAKGYGRTKAKKGLPVNGQTRFRLASVSKTFAGSLTAKLAADEKVDLDRYVADYLPIFRDSQYAPLRVYHLLSHSSGLVPNAYDNLIESRMEYDNIYPRLLKVDRLCRPGICYGYQNVMFSLIGNVIKQATGLSYDTWLNEFIFKPLGMKDAGLGFDHMTKDDNFALPHVKGRKYWHTAKLKKHYYKVAPAAGVNASAEDMVIWLKAQLGLFPSVLSLDALTIQSRPFTLTKRELRRRVWKKYVEQAHYGLGWRIYSFEGETVYYHSGWVQGYRTDVAVIPSLGIGFSLLLNAESGLINQLTTDFLRKAIDLAGKVEPQ
ncbi:serine hydrolase domain-containing protein [Pseudoalteromonas luteoviolacea]|uniref:Beta-lactamase-related domain-containing protein n=1 Tax=Pseudoalteromonas luteoviolacea S4060-1 TaxID=1365257 RepID=A0A167MWG0_9GAMM|nr:serine hydrolase domain-containing protein [Pseudoalteromonas luteoviolacea]KZN67054.1 hypothetical protein N478_19685 [Pseudoalteromonas luteoviolacea S4060-1]